MQGTGRAARILVVDDDPVLRKLLQFMLTEAGYAVAVVDNATTALRLLAREEVHLLVLDVGLPGTTGLELCRQLREQRGNVPILFLSGRQQIEDKVAGFDAGGDDYLVKPFEPRELLVRVRALLQRQIWGATTATQNTLRAGGYELVLAELTVKLPNGEDVQLTPTELRVLQCLMLNPGRVVTRDHILQEAWGYDYESESNQVEVYIRRIRRKIETEPGKICIETVRGMGYRLIVPKAAPQPATHVA